MKVTTLICYSRELDPFRYENLNARVYRLGSTLDISHDMLHSRLCAEWGEKILCELLQAREDNSDTYVMVSARPKESQTVTMTSARLTSNSAESNQIPLFWDRDRNS